jgi:hypothetical protein
MHGTLLALILASSLAPSNLVARLWNLAFGDVAAPTARTLEKAGPGWDPSGFTAQTPAQTEEGPGWDPSGHS